MHITVVLQKGPMGGTHYFMLRQGGGRIFITSLHLLRKSVPCLATSSQDIAHQHTHPVQA